MTLKQLEAFYWAASCANFAIAAERLHLSISSLSKRIAELEDSLGQVLFDRSGHRAVLTDIGKRLLPQALALLDAAAEIRNSLGLSEGLSGRCRFGVGELSALTWLPQFIAEARRRHPALVLEPDVDVGAALEDRLDNGELDFAIIAGRSSRQGILSQPITQARFVWTASPALAEAAGSVSEALCRKQPLICLPRGAGTTRITDDWLMANRVATVETTISCNNWGAIAGMLVASVGVGILPEGWAHRLAERQLLQVMRDGGPIAALTYSFQWRRGDSRPLIESMHALAKELADFSANSQLSLLG